MFDALVKRIKKCLVYYLRIKTTDCLISFFALLVFDNFLGIFDIALKTLYVLIGFRGNSLNRGEAMALLKELISGNGRSHFCELVTKNARSLSTSDKERLLQVRIRRVCKKLWLNH